MKELIKKINDLELALSKLDENTEEYWNTYNKIHDLKEEYNHSITAWDRVCIARDEERLKSEVLISKLFTSFVELHGDQLYGDDASIIAGIGFLRDLPVTVLAQAKGSNLNENIARNFGMTSPEGFRKTLRLAHEAEKFGRPIVTIVDTSGAYPGRGAEERGQARAIAQNLMEFSHLKVPVVAIVLSEGGSGGALALTISDYIFMFENAVYSVLSPEGFSSILFKNKIPASEAAEKMKMTSHDLLDMKIIDEIIPEPFGGVTNPDDELISYIKDKLYNKIYELLDLKIDELLSRRYQKYRSIGAPSEEDI
ncbi:MAG: carboxyltransferase subunit alpha [Anaeroplasma sp.]